MEERGPITGHFPKEERDDDYYLRDLPAHVGFDEAWRDVIRQAEEMWHKKGEPKDEIWVTVEYVARIDITNPGGIGHYQVIVNPTGP
jgi:hypothetical protein